MGMGVLGGKEDRPVEGRVKRVKEGGNVRRSKEE